MSFWIIYFVFMLALPFSSGRKFQCKLYLHKFAMPQRTSWGGRRGIHVFWDFAKYWKKILSLLFRHIRTGGWMVLALPVGPCIKIKISLNFYFHTSLWCLKSFYEGLFMKTFSFCPGLEREGIRNGKIVCKHELYCWYFRLNLFSLRLKLSVATMVLKLLMQLGRSLQIKEIIINALCELQFAA